MVDVNGFDGVHIDFEGVNAGDQALLTSFMTTLSGVFHQHGWLVSQAVIARTSDAPSTWGGAYDYRALAKLNDYIVVMAYDYTGAGSSTPGAMAPLWWVSNVVGYSEDRIPPEKLLLGIPLYGYDWDTKKGGGATAIDYPTAAKLAARPGAKSGFSNDDGAPWIEYTDDQGDTHKVWYEDADSFEKKIEVLIDHDLAGFAVWRVGHEDPADWTIIQGLQTPATRLPPSEDTAVAHLLSGDRPYARVWLSRLLAREWRAGALRLSLDRGVRRAVRDGWQHLHRPVFRARPF